MVGLEEKIREAVEIIRRERMAWNVECVTENAVVDADADADGRLDANPNTGSGSESGSMLVSIRTARFTHDFREQFFSAFLTSDAMARAVIKEVEGTCRAHSPPLGYSPDDDRD